MIVGQGLANKLGLRLGGDITLIAPQGNVTPFGTTPRIKTYHVVGTFKIGNTLYDNNYVFMPLEEAQLYFNTGEGVNGIELMVHDPETGRVAFTRHQQGGRAADPADHLAAAQRQHPQRAGSGTGPPMFLILSLIILVAALNIVSGLIMLVKDKSSDIAILRTMGATRGAMMRGVFSSPAPASAWSGRSWAFLLGVAFATFIEEIR